jgi:two-component system invasion response regulator UvrY
MENEFKVALVDDHILLRNGLAALVDSFSGYRVLFEADNGKDLIEKLSQMGAPDIILLDINMPIMDGYETAQWLKAHYPAIKIMALSMYDQETAVIRMFRHGAKGYILKDTHPKILKEALETLRLKGFYFSEEISGKLVSSLNSMDSEDINLQMILGLQDREIEFLKFACTELTYKEIADKMGVSPRTVDGYRDILFEKLNVRTRQGLVMFAIKNTIVQM